MKEPSDFPATPIRHVGPGTRLNGIYEVESLVATGGMGEVYRGRAIETGIAVAIKMIRPDLAENETVLALFKKEAASLHNLLHDAVVRYYVFSTDPALRRPYLAMEFVEGTALSELLVRGGPMSPDAVGILQRRIAAALDMAHRAGVVHRDISPDNIILPDGDPSRAKLIDFGIARSAVGGETVIGDRFAGKVNYASPEQIGLYGGGAGAKSDIYSLGLTLAAALSGTPLPMGGTQLEIVQKRQQVPNLDKVPAAFRPLLTRMLQPKPDDRPDGLEVSGWYPAGQGPGAGGGVGRSRGWVLPVGVAAALVVSAGLGYLGSRVGTGGTATQPPTTSRTAPSQVQGVPPATILPASSPPSQARPTADALPPIAIPAPEPSAPARLDVQPPAALRTTTDERPPATVPAPIPAPLAQAVAPQPPPAPSGPVRTADGGLKDCATCPELIEVPAGRFRMGSAADPTERPIHDVQVRAFMAGRYPVTAAEWRVCVREKGCAFDPGGEPDAPVHNISYDDAQQYVRWLSQGTGNRYRLLSEAEWEYAARAGTSTTYWWGDLFRSDRATCRTCSDPAPRTPPRVGRYPANPFGIYDVTGSVGQWVEDCWHKDFRGAPADGSAWDAPQCRERVLRGGSWLGDAVALRIASRDFYEASVRYPGHGFRIARDM